MTIQQDAPNPVRAGEELNIAALEAYLPIGPITQVMQFPGGYSNLTYLLVCDKKQYVLRRPPVGAKAIKGGHDMGREFRVLSLLQQAGYAKIPQPVAYCEDESVIGCPFYVMERVPGVILRAQSAPKLGLSEPTMRRLSEALVDTLVELHALPVQPDLVQLGKPDGYVQRQVEGWHKRYLAAQTDDLPAMNELARYLTDNLPAQTSDVTLLHNDFKYDNVVMDAELTRLREQPIRAVLDWEMCTVGDPLMDVGTSLSYWAEAADDPFRKSFNLTWLPGNLTRHEFAQRYADRSGRDVSNILYYYVFGLFKNAVVIQQIYGRYKQGLTKDERFSGLLAGVQALSGVGVQAVETGQL
ncbi:phosphotransferase family protein [Fibrella aquatilis]|uniref:Phosphotransferase family protein n=1 Tax=Fibrella aquatilis TaxID=2817059 RepID=A0A939G908_9BACT|nr:phosphotransferase family protein [Fibrella aquatilis]MBO0932849.1 phosphotransferase family protein [Fibrella aquatilis]